jgi:hypothetical protein
MASSTSILRAVRVMANESDARVAAIKALLEPSSTATTLVVERYEQHIAPLRTHQDNDASVFFLVWASTASLLRALQPDPLSKPEPLLACIKMTRAEAAAQCSRFALLQKAELFTDKPAHMGIVFATSLPLSLVTQDKATDAIQVFACTVLSRALD